MDEKRLLEIIQRILQKSNPAQIGPVLGQLYSILEEDGVPQDLRDLVKGARESYPESKEEADKTSVLTKAELAVARRRAAERKQREELARSQSRC